MFPVYELSRVNHMLVENSKSQTKNIPLLLFSPLTNQYRNALMCFHGKLINRTSEGFLEGAQSFLLQTRQKGHVQFLCVTFCKKRLNKNFTN